MRRRARVLVADPPWLFKDKLGERGAEANYSCLSLDNIKGFPLPPLDRNCWLFLWTVASMREEGYEVLRAWEFAPTGGQLTWVKTTRDCVAIIDPHASSMDLDEMFEAFPINERTSVRALFGRLAFGMGRTTRATDEVCLIGRRGKPERRSRSIRSVFFAPLGEHSAKPDRFYNLVEEFADGPYVELFARRRRRGWTCCGDEVDERKRAVR